MIRNGIQDSNGRFVCGRIKVSELSEQELYELRNVSEDPSWLERYKSHPDITAWECYWKNKRFLMEELQNFLWYYDNRPELHYLIGCEYIELEPEK